jgi:glycine dehydrogenase
MISIRKEIEASTDEQNNVLKNAPHTLAMLTADSWTLPYSREAAYPLDLLR